MAKKDETEQFGAILTDAEKSGQQASTIVPSMQHPQSASNAEF